MVNLFIKDLLVTQQAVYFISTDRAVHIYHTVNKSIPKDLPRYRYYDYGFKSVLSFLLNNQIVWNN